MNRQVRLISLTLSILLLVTLTITACGSSATTVTSAVLGRSYPNDGNMTEATDTFAPTDPAVFLLAKLANVVDGTSLKASWYALEGNAPRLIQEGSQTLGKGEDIAVFTLGNEQGWPVGTYRVELSLNGKPDKTLEFVVKE